eukprot:gene11862-12938_t
MIIIVILIAILGVIDGATFSLSSLSSSTQGTTIAGQSLSYTGFSVAIGDVNHDGVQDVIIGAPNYNTQTGRVYIVSGGSTLSSITLPSTFVTLDGSSANYYAAFNLAVVDYNGDGEDDLLICGFKSSSSTHQVTYLVPGPITMSMDFQTTPPITISSGSSYWVGFSAASAGDLNSDGSKDFLLGGGQVYLVYGSSSLISFQVSPSISGGVVFTSTDNDCTFVVAGGADINGDAVPDILMGNRAFSSNSGVVYLVYGSGSLANMNLDAMSDSAIGIAIAAEGTGDQLGSSVAFLGDFNGDGPNDFAISAPYASGGSGFGKVYIIFGLASGATYTSISLSSLGSGGVIFTGSTGHFGNSITSVADISNDSKCEILIGNAAGGTAYLIYGTTNTATVTTSTIAGGGYGFEITGATQSSLTTYYTSSSVASGSDIYDDGEVAVVIGASGSSSNAGVTYVMKGSALFTFPTSEMSGYSSQPTALPSAQPYSEPTSKPTNRESNGLSMNARVTNVVKKRRALLDSTSPTSEPSDPEINQNVFDRRRYSVDSKCENNCNGHGTCGMGQCNCYKDLNDEDVWYGVDCSLRACPKGYAWSSAVLVRNNDIHPWVECSNRGECDRDTGECICDEGFEGIACQRLRCFNDCNGHGQCLPEKAFAERAGYNYTTPWDASKMWGCLCDSGYRGPDCSQRECPSREDPLGGFGNESGRDCSGRGKCDYNTGLCRCFNGFHGAACNKQAVTF